MLLINLAFFALEIFAGYLARSMGLVADGSGLLADSFAYGLSLYAVGPLARHKGGVATASGVIQLLLALLGLDAESARRSRNAGPHRNGSR